jgi:predicted nucleic acid-binding protein
MVVVSDTSPITNLLKIGKIDLLQQIFGEVIIPVGVYEELTRIPAQKKKIENINWIKKHNARDEILISNLLKLLDKGESESIALDADYLLIDERKGRKVANEYGLTITGILGVLRKAKFKGQIEKVKPLLDQLRKDAGFRIHQKLYEEILKDVGEGV